MAIEVSPSAGGESGKWRRAKIVNDLKTHYLQEKKWSQLSDLNRRPTVYKTVFATSRLRHLLAITRMNTATNRNINGFMELSIKGAIMQSKCCKLLHGLFAQIFAHRPPHTGGSLTTTPSSQNSVIIRSSGEHMSPKADTTPIGAVSSSILVNQPT